MENCFGIISFVGRLHKWCTADKHHSQRVTIWTGQFRPKTLYFILKDDIHEGVGMKDFLGLSLQRRGDPSGFGHDGCPERIIASDLSRRIWVGRPYSL